MNRVRASCSLLIRGRLDRGHFRERGRTSTVESRVVLPQRLCMYVSTADFDRAFILSCSVAVGVEFTRFFADAVSFGKRRVRLKEGRERRGGGTKNEARADTVIR